MKAYDELGKEEARKTKKNSLFSAEATGKMIGSILGK